MARFAITIDGVIWLDTDQIWPDGDAPEDPTAEDVQAVIEECGGMESVFTDWRLCDSTWLHVRKVQE